MIILNKIEDFWLGKIALWKSYWIIGELINALIVIIIFNIELKFFNNTLLFEKIPLLIFSHLHFTNKLIILLWSLFITVGIWRSAEKYQGRLIWTILTLVVLSYRLFSLREIFN
tara:strand:- start:405 stop:746 length:342 start_codon:yes stop_codon:yes gene_type:complete